MFLLENHTQNVVQKSEFNIFLDQVLNFTQFCFLVCLRRALPKYMETKVMTKDCLGFL